MKVPDDMTHWGSLYGIPIYIGDIDSDSPKIMGQNWFYDWLIEYAVPPYQAMLSFIGGALFGVEVGFPVCVKGHLERDK